MSMQLPYPESTAAYVALLDNYDGWRRAESRFDQAPTTVHAAAADVWWFTLIHHAKNCGMPLTAPSVLEWIETKVVAFVEAIR